MANGLGRTLQRQQRRNMIPYVALLVATLLGVVAESPDFHEQCRGNLTATVDECCKIPPLFNMTIVSQCRKKFPFKFDKPAKGVAQHSEKHHAATCVASCILTERGMFKDEKLEVAAFKQQVQKTINAGWAVPAIDKCASQATLDPGFLKHPVLPGDGMPVCSIIPKLFINCVYSTLYLTCPAAEWTDRKECHALKAKLNEGCPYFALRRRHKRGN